jgi:hypothetical protein
MATLGLSDGKIDSAAEKNRQRPLDTFVTHEFSKIAKLAASEM